jgi:hypothetical protein
MFARKQRFACARLPDAHLTHDLRRFHIPHHGRVTTPAASGGLKPPPQGDSEGPTILHLLHSTPSRSSTYVELLAIAGGGQGIIEHDPPCANPADRRLVSVLGDGQLSVTVALLDFRSVSRCQIRRHGNTPPNGDLAARMGSFSRGVGGRRRIRNRSRIANFSALLAPIFAAESADPGFA